MKSTIILSILCVFYFACKSDSDSPTQQNSYNYVTPNVTVRDSSSQSIITSAVVEAPDFDKRSSTNHAGEAYLVFSFPASQGASIMVDCIVSHSSYVSKSVIIECFPGNTPDPNDFEHVWLVKK